MTETAILITSEQLTEHEQNLVVGAMVQELRAMGKEVTSAQAKEFDPSLGGLTIYQP